MSCQPSAAPMPVPNALEMASLAANRAARNGAGRWCDEAVGDLVRQQNPVHEPLAKFFVGGRDARHFDDVDAGAENHDGVGWFKCARFNAGTARGSTKIMRDLPGLSRRHPIYHLLSGNQEAMNLNFLVSWFPYSFSPLASSPQMFRIFPLPARI